MDDAFRTQIERLLLILLEATEMEGVKAWSMQIAFEYALAKAPHLNRKDVWKLIEQVYEENLKQLFPGQRDPAQSFRRASGDAFEAYVQAYLNSSSILQNEGIQAVRLRGKDFAGLMGRLGLPLRVKDVDLFLQGIGDEGIPRIFGALFPKASYAERIRADEGASRALMNTGLWSATVTLDARGELGTEERPSVKRQTINNGAFNACFSFNSETSPGPRIYVVDPREHTLGRNPFIAGIVHAWRAFKRSPVSAQ